MMTNQSILPDVLQTGLLAVFCGTAAGKASAHMRAYYAHPNNKFWSILHQVGMTPDQLLPHQFMKLIESKMGLTDLCKDGSGNDNEIRKVTAEDRSALRQKIADFRPSHLAFTSKEAGKRFFGRGRVELGLQEEAIAQTKLWVLPSTSLMAAWQWKETKVHWQTFADAIKTQ